MQGWLVLAYVFFALFLFCRQSAAKVWIPVLLALACLFASVGWWPISTAILVSVPVFIAAILALVAPLRLYCVVRPIRGWFRRKQPPISSAEQVVLDAGGTWWEKEVFSGKVHWERVLNHQFDPLTDEEKNFLSHQTETLCDMLNEWEINNKRKDLPPEAWDYIKQQGFWALCMDKRYGGLGFSHSAHSAIVTKIASRSISAAYTVMVPNSLGPAELIDYCGTDEQKDFYLPRLARGEEVGCFGLTGLHAGSDAASIPDRGVVCHGVHNGNDVIGIRLSFSKRYITLAPVATLIGLAFRLYDPDHHLGDASDIGITVALVPSSHAGVESGQRHSPTTMGFMNGTLHGEDVFIPLEWVIGGADNVGQGWKILMGCLSVGRGISMPALSAAIAQQSLTLAGAYSKIRPQFNRSVCEFEGVKEALAQIAGLGYLVEANRYGLAQAVNEGARPSVAAGIAKYHMTELARRLLQMAMDVHSGHALQAGPSNLLAEVYAGFPISTVGEGANIMTRNLIIFGQGVMRAHPYVRDEILAAVNEPNDKKSLREFDRVFFKHAGLAVATWLRALRYAWIPWVSVPGSLKSLSKEVHMLNRFSNALLMVSDMALVFLGKELKIKESISARLGDVLSYLYMATATVKYFHDQEKADNEIAFAKWAIQYCLHHASRAMKLFFDNFSSRFMAFVMRGVAFPFGLDMPLPKDALGFEIADSIITPTAMRSRLSALCYKGNTSNDPVGRVIRAWEAVMKTEHLDAKVELAIKQKKIHRALTREETITAAKEAGVISNSEAEQMINTEQKRNCAMQVDVFAFDELLRFNAEVLE